MSIIDKLKLNVETTTGLPFVYGAQGDVNRALDYTALPCVFAYLIDTSAVEDVNGLCHERLTLALFFVNKTTFDFEGVENEGIIDGMKRRAFAWYANARTWDTLRLIGVNSALRVYDEIADATITGYALNVTIEEVEGVGRCNAPQPDPKPEEENEGE